MPHVGNEEPPRNVEVSISVEKSAHAVDEESLRRVVADIVHDSTFDSAAISLAVVDDATIHELNRRYLEHDYPTDVLSFLLDDDSGHLEGEVIISADTAARVAEEIGWPLAAEQMLYVIHGTLHLVGYNDTTSEDAAEMRTAEVRYLALFGYEGRVECSQEVAGSSAEAPRCEGAAT
jgi:probable rRNA maturation factor